MNTLIAICGTIGSGKSTVANYLQKKGFCVLDCDKIARQVADQPDTVLEVKNLLGEEFIENAKLNRSKIRQKIFSDAKILAKYNDIFTQKIKNQLFYEISQQNGVVFVEIPLINAVDINWHQIWLVTAHENQQIERVLLRDDVTAQNVLETLKNQPSAATFTHQIDNSKDLSHLFRQIDTLLSSLQG